MRDKINHCLSFYVQTMWYRLEKCSSFDLFNSSLIHINLVGLTGRCGRDRLAMAVLQGRVLWVWCVFVRMCVEGEVDGYY